VIESIGVPLEDLDLETRLIENLPALAEAVEIAAELKT
jgi:hypothetical protein